MSTHFKRILYGGDYNPNQWTKDIWQEDMRIFKDAHINTATINVFSWAIRSLLSSIILTLSKWQTIS